MGNLRVVLDIDGASGTEQERLITAMKRTGAYVRAGASPPIDTFPFHDSTISEQLVRERAEGAIKLAGLEGRVRILRIEPIRPGAPLNELIISNDHNVYILGAGFSVHAGLPVISNFMKRMRDASEWLKDGRRNIESDAIKHVLEFRLTAAAAALRIKVDPENVEHLFSLAAAEGPELWADMRIAIAGTLDYCAQTTPRAKVQFARQLVDGTPAPLQWMSLRKDISSNNQEVLECDPYAFYVARLCGPLAEQRASSKDTFITFNYDTLLEDGLATVGVPFDYCLPTSGLLSPVKIDATAKIARSSGALPVRVLKLHGSVNWAAHRGVPGEPMTCFGTYADLVQARVNNPLLTPALVPPTWKKAFDGPLEPIWEASVDALRTATRIVIVGFSMAPGDAHFKYLLAAGLRENISLRDTVLVNKDGVPRERLDDLLSPGHPVTSHTKDAHSFIVEIPTLSTIGRNVPRKWIGSYN